MITFLNLLQDKEFRSYVQKRLASYAGNKEYVFPNSFPALYRYRPLSEYAVNDIIQNRLTLTSIGEFNDLFDGAFHKNSAKEGCEKTLSYTKYLRNETRLKFRELEYLGTYVCCFSAKSDSTLMWSHYANCSRGVCVEYDFNQLPDMNLLKEAVFPVYYSEAPIDLTDLLNDDSYLIYKYSLDAAVLCSALNKATPWQYEHEWRLVWELSGIIDIAENNKWLSVQLALQPKSISLGYHFLKNFFCYNTNNFEERAKEQEKLNHTLQRFYQLLDYVDKHQIRLSLMVPIVGTYQLSSRTLSVQSLKRFMHEYFDKNYTHHISLYYVIHDVLIELVEKEQSHV